MFNTEDVNHLKNIDDYVNIINNKGFDYFIEVIKITEILINKYGRKIKHSLIKEINNYINDNLDDSQKNKWANIKEDTELINEIYNRYYSLDKQEIMESSKPLESFLIVTEKFLQYINNIVDDNEKNNTDLDIIFKVEENKSMRRKKFYMQVHQNITMLLNSITSSFIFYEYKDSLIMPNIIIPEKELLEATKHFSNVQVNNIINYAVDSWKYGGRKIKKEDDTILFQIIGDLDESYFLINERDKSIENKIYITTSHIIRNITKSNNIDECYEKGTNIKQYICLEEFYTCVFLMEYFNVDDLTLCTYNVSNINYEDVSVKELVRAYYVILEKCKNFIKERNNNTDRNNSLEYWGLLINNEDIIQMFIKNGIDFKNAEYLIKQITYRKGVDIFDAPLICIESGFLILPNILVNIQIERLVLSLINKVDQRGNLFEKYICERITSSNTECMDLYIKDIEEYQCDLAISIGDDLYLCECKAWNRIKNLNGYYSMFLKMNEAKKQLDRIYYKFSNEIDFLNLKFGFEKDHKFNNINKLVITLNMQGLFRKIEDTYFIDSSSIIKFFDRESPSVNMLYGKNHKKYKLEGYKDYEGKITNYKFMNIIKNPANIEITRKNKKVVINEINLEGLRIKIPVYCTKYESTRIVDTK